MACGQLGILAAEQGNFDKAGYWFARSIVGFLLMGDRHEVERNVSNFLTAHRKAPPEKKEELQAIWAEVGLGPFPEPKGSNTNRKRSVKPRKKSSPRPRRKN